MGAEPYEYTVPYEADIQSALNKLRTHVFESGDFRGAEMNPSRPEEALMMMEEEGTASILDIMHVSETPDFFCASPYSPAKLQQHFGTEKPTRELVTQSMEFAEHIERGHCRYVILYEGDEPTQIYFFGYSFD